MATIYTIGHSTRSAEEFVHILRRFGIELLADIRTIPRSRKNPQFEGGTLRGELPSHGIEYVHLPDLGGLRHPKKNSVNRAWTNDAFRGYADYMQTDQFALAVQHMVELAKTKSCAMMCAEAVPWRCHRSLVADALLVRCLTVVDILSVTSTKPHHLTPWAHVRGTIVTYPKRVDCATMEQDDSDGSQSDFV